MIPSSSKNPDYKSDLEQQIEAERKKFIRQYIVSDGQTTLDELKQQNLFNEFNLATRDKAYAYYRVAHDEE